MSDLQEGNVSCQWRSCHGNSYAVVKGSDVAELARKLKQKKKDEEEERLVSEHGKEGLAKIREKEQAHLAKEREESQKRKAITAARTRMRTLMLEITKLAPGAELSSLESGLINKGDAKARYNLTDLDFKRLTSVQSGRSKCFTAEALLAAAERKYSKAGFTRKRQQALDATNRKTRQGLKMELRKLVATHGKELESEVREKVLEELEAIACQAEKLALRARANVQQFTEQATAKLDSPSMTSPGGATFALFQKTPANKRKKGATAAGATPADKPNASKKTQSASKKAMIKTIDVTDVAEEPEEQPPLPKRARKVVNYGGCDGDNSSDGDGGSD
jgi:hypothetical protein